MTLRDAVRPVYLPSWVRVGAIAFGGLIALPPIAHMLAHVWLMLHGVQSTDTGSDWPKVVLIVVGAGIGFPDPVIGMILAWRRKRQADTEEREAGR